MQFDVLTLFPEMFNILNESIIGRAKEKGLINVNLINIRDFSKNKHKKVDDTPYGGGAGMVIQPDVVYDAYKSVISNIEDVRNVTNLKKLENTENVEKSTFSLFLCLRTFINSCVLVIKLHLEHLKSVMQDCDCRRNKN